MHALVLIMSPFHHSPAANGSRFFRRLPFRIAESRCYFPKTSRMASIVFQLRVVAGTPRCFSTTALEYV